MKVYKKPCLQVCNLELIDVLAVSGFGDTFLDWSDLSGMSSGN